MNFKFEIGQKVKDKITGFKGIVTSRSQWLNGCNTYGLTSQKLKEDGSVQATQHFDEPQLLSVGAKVLVEPTQKTGGPIKPAPQPNR